MQEPEQNPQSDFMIEKIKKRPVSRRKLFHRTLVTVTMAVIFGLVACVTFIVLQPIISKRLYPEEEAPLTQPVVFPEDPEEEEMSPEEMLADNITPEEPETTPDPEEPEGIILEEEQIQEILSEVVLDRENYKQIYTALSDYVAELNRCMVTVTGISSNVDWFNNVEQSKKQSSGVIIADNGMELLILADYTPLQNAESLFMTFSGLDTAANSRSEYQIPVTLKSLDKNTYLAVLAAERGVIPAEILEWEDEEQAPFIATLGSSNSRNMVGMPVIALGSPMGVSESMGYGMITAVNTQYQQADANYKIIQTDIYGSQNAGGVLFNLQNQVIGIITSPKAGTDMRNVVNAFGISELKKTIEKMSNEIPLPYLGITGIDVTADAHGNLGVPYGAFVRNLDMNSSAMLAGIQKGDVITMFGERAIYSYNDYINALMQTSVGDSVSITVMRAAQEEYKEMTFEVTLGER